MYCVTSLLICVCVCVRLVVALAVTMGLFAIELAGFFSGVSMFNCSQGLLCILYIDSAAPTENRGMSPTYICRLNLQPCRAFLSQHISVIYKQTNKKQCPDRFESDRQRC